MTDDMDHPAGLGDGAEAGSAQPEDDRRPVSAHEAPDADGPADPASTEANGAPPGGGPDWQPASDHQPDDGPGEPADAEVNNIASDAEPDREPASAHQPDNGPGEPANAAVNNIASDAEPDREPASAHAPPTDFDCPAAAADANASSAEPRADLVGDRQPASAQEPSTELDRPAGPATAEANSVEPGGDHGLADGELEASTGIGLPAEPAETVAALEPGTCLPASEPSSAGGVPAASAEPDEDALRLAEALVFASANPVSARALSQLLPDTIDAEAVITALRARYAGRGVELAEVGNGVQFRTAADLAPRLRKVIEVPRRLPRVAMETLAIIAYHQPVTRAEVEDIRGTSLSQQTLDALLEAGLVAPKGRKETPGRPTLWGTTPQFLAQFGLKDMRELPRREDLLLEPPQPAAGPVSEARDPVPAEQVVASDP